jgi:hypothetical protein
MIRMQIQLTPVQLDALRRESERQDASQAEIVRRALARYLGTPAAPERSVLRERARLLIGAFPGGPSDGAARHDEYLADTLADWSLTEAADPLEGAVDPVGGDEEAS